MTALRAETSAPVRRRRLAVVTNLPAYYRRPLFERLAERFETEFFFTGAGEDAWLPQHGRTPATHGARALGAAIRAGGYDCVVCGLTGRFSLLATVRAARSAGIPFVLWVGIWAHPRTLAHTLSRPLVRRLYRRADALVVYGPHVARHIARESGRTGGVFVAPQAVEAERFRADVPAGEPERLRGRLGASRSVVLYVGRLEREKGLDVLLYALARSQERSTLVLAGAGSQEAALRRLARELEIEDRVRFVGYVPQERLPVVLRSADLLVLPSVRTRRFLEPWGLVANEAMHAGVPVLATDAVGAAAGGLVVDGETGRIVPERDPDALAAALDELARDAELRERLGAGARNHVLRWSHEAQAEAFERAVETACAS